MTVIIWLTGVTSVLQKYQRRIILGGLGTVLKTDGSVNSRLEFDSTIPPPNNMALRCSWTHSCLSNSRTGIVTPQGRQIQRAVIELGFLTVLQAVIEGFDSLTVHQIICGISSIGRALHCHCRGKGIETPMSRQNNMDDRYAGR